MAFYRLSFEDADPSSAFNDWLITYMKINTDKIMLDDKESALFMNPTVLYTSISQPTDISLNIWYPQQKQNVTFESEKNNFVVNLEDKDINKTASFHLEPGNYKILFRGNLKISGAYFALSKENYFEIYSSKIVKENPDFVFTKSEFEKESDGFIKIKKTFNPEDLEILELAKYVNFQLRNSTLNKNFKELSVIYEKGYEVVSGFGNYKLLGRKAILKNTNKSADATDWINNVIPENSTIKNKTKIILDESKKNKSITILTEESDLNPDYFLINSNLFGAEIKNIQINVQ